MEDEFEKIQITFTGEIADKGQIHFYEYSRSQYASARYFSYIEHFRRTGRIARRVSRLSYVNMIVESPKEESFVETILLPAVKEGMATAVSMPLSAFISYMWTVIVPRSQGVDQAVVRLAEAKSIELSTAVEIEAERTEQLAQMRGIVEAGQAPVLAAIELVSSALQKYDAEGNDAGLSREELIEAQRELKTELAREQEIKQNEDEISKIEQEDILKLTHRVTPVIEEMAKPLQRSAKKMSISTGDEATPLLEIDNRVVSELKSRELEKNITAVRGRIKIFDRDFVKG